MNKELLDYFNGDELAANVWHSKYAMEGEITPDDMQKRLSSEISRADKKYWYKEGNNKHTLLSEYGQTRQELTTEKTYNLFKGFNNIILQGSCMYGIGRPIPVSIGNCFVINSSHDSYAGIMYTDQQQAQLMKRRAGVGHDVSNLRPEETEVQNAAGTSTGVVSFMERFSNTTREVAQNGRRGALMLSIDINHPDVEKFATVKSDKNKVTGANISIKVNDDFMKAVEKDEGYILRFPCDAHLSIKKYDEWYPNWDNGKLNYIPKDDVYVKTIKAKELWNTIVKQARDNAEPGLMFWDNVLDYSPDGVYAKYKPISSNPCVTGDTTVLTDKGYYPIQDLIGEKVKVWNGEEFSEVTPKITGTNQEILTIKLSDGRELKCTPSHKWYLWKGNSRGGKPLVKEAKDLIIRDKIEKYKFPIINSGTTVVDKVAYSQGFYSGDGNKNSSSIWLYNGKINLSDKLSGNFIGAEYTTNTGSKKRMFKLNFKNKPKEFVPTNEYSLKSKLDWLAGLIDSDGVLTNEKGLQIVSVDYNFLSNVQNLLSTLSCNSKIVSERDGGLRSLPDGRGGYKQYLCKETNRILIGAYQVKQLIELGLKTYRIDLSNVNPDRDASRFVTIVSIEKQSKLEGFVYCFTEPKKHKGVFNGILTGQCGEQYLQAEDSCRLAAQNLFGVVQKPFMADAYIDYDLLYEVSYELQRIMDDIIDLEVEKIDMIIDKIKNDPEPKHVKQTELDLWKSIKETAINGRRTGSGITALADTLAAVGLKYDSEEALKTTEKMMNVKMKAELDCMIDMSIIRGSFKDWNPDLEFIDSKGTNSFYEFLMVTFPEQCKKMKKYGRRNINWSTVAPTGSVSILAQTSSGCEPLFQAFYTRRKKVNPSDKNARVDFVDDSGDTWQEFPVLHPKFKGYILSKYPKLDLSTYSQEDFTREYEESPWHKAIANDIDWNKRVEMQSILQRYTSNAISSTLNLPEDVTTEQVQGIYLEAWKKGLKGQTVYRDGSRSGVLVSNTKKEEKFEDKKAPKRPKELEAESYVTSVKGDKFFVIVGLLEGKPYEVFCASGTGKTGKGVVSKEAQGEYNFVIENGHSYSKIITDKMTDEQAGLSRMISLALRHGANIKFAVEQLLKADGNFQSFNKAIARTLKKYIKDGERSTFTCDNCGSENVVFMEGCETCRDCGNSKCS